MNDLVYRLRKRAEIREQISTRKSVQEGKPDRIAALLKEAADRIEELEVGADSSPSVEDLDQCVQRELDNLKLSALAKTTVDHRKAGLAALLGQWPGKKDDTDEDPK